MKTNEEDNLIFISDDGKIFTDRNECNRYEELVLYPITYCDMGVDRGNFYNKLSDSIKRNLVTHCRNKAKYIVTSSNSKGIVQTMKLCERHKKDVEKRFTIIECEIIKDNK